MEKKISRHETLRKVARVTGCIYMVLVLVAAFIEGLNNLKK